MIIGPENVFLATDRLPAVVVYIIGAGHSGSTILDAVLGLHDEIVAGGEIRQLSRLQGGELRRCACGALADECPFWRRVYELWKARCGPEVEESWAKLRTAYERIRSAPRFARDAILWPSRWRSYAEVSLGLLVSIRDAAGVRVVADSSKSPMRAYVLMNIRGLEVVLLHLVRDPRGVVWSRLKAGGLLHDVRRAGPRVVWLTVRLILDWILVNLLSEVLLASGERGSRIRYEDLVSKPQDSLAAIQDLLDIDLSAVGQKIADGKAVTYRHLVGGNRRRLMGPAPLVLDQEWCEASPRWVRRLVWALAGPLARHYGYQR